MFEQNRFQLTEGRHRACLQLIFIIRNVVNATVGATGQSLLS